MKGEFFMFLQALFNGVFQVVLFSIIPFIWWLITARKKEKFFSWIGFKKPAIENKKKWGLIFIATIILCWVLAQFAIYLRGPMDAAESQYTGMGTAAIPSILAYAFIQTALSEEILFRGFLLKRLSSKFGFNTANIIQAAIFGADANWGRVLCAIGYSGADVDVNAVDVSFRSTKGEIMVCQNGASLPFSEKTSSRKLFAFPLRKRGLARLPRAGANGIKKRASLQILQGCSFLFRPFPVLDRRKQKLGDAPHLGRHGAKNVYALPRRRVAKMQFPRVQALARHETAVAFFKARAVASVNRVAKQRMPNGGHVHADLVRSARFKAAFNKAHAVKFLKRAPMRNRLSRGGVSHDRHLLAVNGMSADRGVHRAAFLARLAYDERNICPECAMLLYLLRERGVGDIVLRHDQKPRRVLVYSVHDAGARNAADARQTLAAMI